MRVVLRGVLLGGVLLSTVAVRGFAQSDAIADAVAALQRGDYATAETMLRARSHDADAIGLLGVVLDQEKKYAEADEAYRRALALTPRSAGLLNNYGNHLLVTGKVKEARPVFVKVLAVDPSHANALMQLARIALEQKEPAEALRYLDRLPNSAAAGEMLRMQALYAVHRDREADALLEQVGPHATEEDVGVALASVRQYAKAVQWFERALEKHPGDFAITYQLGLAASHAGQWDRARDALQAALQQQPQNVDVLYDLAAVRDQTGNEEQALELLVQAAGLAPERADVQRLLARTTADLGYFGDAVKAWDQYAKLVPNDDEARRERGFAETALGENAARGIADLEWFVRKHPQDALGHFELGTAVAVADAARAQQELNRALALNPELAAAHVARGILEYREGRFDAALPDFAFAVKRDPKNAAYADRLGETYLQLGRAAEAVPVLREAAALAPRDTRVLLHLGRALTAAGDAEEAKPVMARVRELGADRSGLPHPAGLVDFLARSPEEQMARYRAGVERTVAKDPANVEAQARYARLLLDSGEFDRALQVSKTVVALKPSDSVLSALGDAWIAAKQYGAAAEIIRAAGDRPGLLLDFAIAELHSKGAAAGLEVLDRIAPGQRDADYDLARGLMLPVGQAEAEFRKALGRRPVREDLIVAASLALLKSGAAADASRLLDQGLTAFPDSPEISLLQAVAMERSGKAEQSSALLKRIAGRWPEWAEVWKVQALVLVSKHKYDEAWGMIQTAIGLAMGDESIRAIALDIAQKRNDFAGADEQAKARAYIIAQKPVREGQSDPDDIGALFH